MLRGLLQSRGFRGFRGGVSYVAWPRRAVRISFWIAGTILEARPGHPCGPDDLGFRV